ncbi:MAG: bifunctional isocitrate dehydrogenase kinase/phosphatase [Candidatus Thiodiazotropha sp. (ex Myrtea spinifera)]|nr:bifunctional isocitrate dehydrogenase kinase/phosphatase [Candidatus Thiodiazotropha sp. (ex Myrtea spinifera)]MCU7830677.1 bifunctional isocitrate dehydrogenase kinase/phosphatase [Candidatus Thiodiazotropha sp. (ex Myrtea sp. 'scaly one' KF741663)]
MTQDLSRQIAQSILTGFDRHFSFFQEISSAARQRFERADWESVREASAKRISFYDLRVQEAVSKMSSNFGMKAVDEGLWQEVKLTYTTLLKNHSRPELAETFYNSVFCRLFERKYYDNDKIFIESQVNRQDLAERYRVYMSFQVADGGLKNSFWEILSSFYFNLPYEDIQRDSQRLADAFMAQTGFETIPADLRFDLLESPFYRNKASYLVGRMVYGKVIRPVIIPLMNNESGSLYADALLTQNRRVEAVFSFARAYFMVKTPVPTATVEFLRSIMPEKTLADLYMSIGLHKQAKNEFYRDLLKHLDKSQDPFSIAPGTPGLVMQVFTLPSFPYVFKVIRDKFPPQKEVTHQLVKQRYLQVKKHDRVGRMADTLEFVDVALPVDRIDDHLLQELKASVPSQLEFEGDKLVIKHLYIEQRMTPLNLYLEETDEEETRQILYDWGKAVKQLMGVNIFPGDLLFKNFGVNCMGKVVFYDYDEICYLTECNFRKIPEPRNPEDIYRDEPWYSVNPNDIFPEEFITFLSTDPKVRKILREIHPELFDAAYWHSNQQDVEEGRQADVFPYSRTLRFTRPEIPTSALPIASTA